MTPLGWTLGQALDLQLQLCREFASLLRVTLQQLLQVVIIYACGRGVEAVLPVLAGLNQLIQRGRDIVHAVSCNPVRPTGHRDASSSVSSLSSASILMTLSASSVSFSSVVSSSSRFCPR